MRVLIFILCFCLSCPAFARIQRITDGDPAPFTGYIIDDEQEAKFRQINEINKLNEEEILKLKQLHRISEGETEYYKKAYTDTREELDKEQKSGIIKAGLFFAGGIALTMGIGWIILIAVP